MAIQSLENQLKTAYGLLFKHTQMSREQFQNEFKAGGIKRIKNLVEMLYTNPDELAELVVIDQTPEELSHVRRGRKF